MKRTILALLLIVSLLPAAAAAEAAYASGAGVAVPVSMGEFLACYPDSETENPDGSVTELYTGVSPDTVDAFAGFLSDRSARFLKDEQKAATREEAALMAGIISIDSLDGVALPFEYNWDTAEIRITYPAGTYDARRRLAAEEYEQMAALADAGQYEEAVAAYLRIPDFRQYAPAAEYLAGSSALSAALNRYRFRIRGEYVAFGRWEQDNDESNGPEDIEWLVLDVQGGKSLLVSRYVIDAAPYNTEYAAVTWESCSLRAWLNNDFFFSAFSEAEHGAVLLSDVDNGAGQGTGEYDTSGGNNTRDRLFLLSFSEAYRYFEEDQDRICSPTALAARKGVWTAAGSEARACAWWLRSPGSLPGCAMRVSSGGDCRSAFADYDEPGVRPAFWIDLDSGAF